MNTKLKICIPICIISITIASSILAGSITGNKLKYPKAEVLVMKVSNDEVVYNTKSKILSIIDANINDTSLLDKESILEKIQYYMIQYDKGKNHNFIVSIDEKLQNLQEIRNTEQREHFNKMSLDGRVLATNIFSEICKEYSIEIAYDLNGNIVKLNYLSGENIYENEIVKSSHQIRIEILVGTLVAIICFNIICIYIAKKKQLFVKDGGYDGYGKEEFA